MTEPAPEYVNAYLDGNAMVLLHRDDAGKLIETRKPAEWITYFRLEDLSQEMRRTLRSSANVASIAFEHLDVEGPQATKGWVRVGWNSREARAAVLDKSSPVRRHLTIYEGDLHPIRRFFSDTGARIQKPRRVYLDIETDSRVPFSEKERARILCWSLVDDTQTCVAEGVLDVDTDADEKRMLLELWRALDPFDQVVSYSSKWGDTFDFAMVFARSEKYRLPVNAKRWLWLDHLTTFERMNNAESGDEKASMKLGVVAQALLGEGKHDFDARYTWQEWEAGGERRARMVAYCRQDTMLLPKIEKKTGFLKLFQTLCDVCRQFPDTRGLNPMGQVDGFLLRLGVTRGHHFGTKYYREENVEAEQFAGAYVKQPEFKGIAKNVQVADFTSMYPSIIITWNMSPETRRHKSPHPIPGHSWSPLTKVLFDTSKPGILPEALIELMRMRAYWNERKASLPPGTPEWHEADLWTTAYKVAANSFYGVMGAPTSRYFDRDLAESVTQCGVWLIKRSEAEAGKLKCTIPQADGIETWHTGYIDTDALYVRGCDEASFRTFTKWCNAELYPKIVADVGCVTNIVSLAYEKEYERVVFTSAKRYVGIYAHYKGKRATAASKPEIKGLEFRRGDQPLLARKLQKDIIDLFCTKSEDPKLYEEIVSATKRHVLQDSLTIEEVSQSKGLSKPLDAYQIRKSTLGNDIAQPIHIRVAKMMRERGEDVTPGTRISYVYLDADNGKIIPGGDYKGECDRFHLWESMVWPPTMRLLECMFPGTGWSHHDRVRPPKVRKKRSQVNANQTAMPFAVEQVQPNASPIPAMLGGGLGANGAVAQPPQSALREEDDDTLLLGMDPESLVAMAELEAFATTEPGKYVDSETRTFAEMDRELRAAPPPPPPPPEAPPSAPAVTTEQPATLAVAGRRTRTQAAPFRFDVHASGVTKEKLLALAEVLKASPGKRPVFMTVVTPDQARVELDLKTKVDVTPELQATVARCFAPS